MRKGFLCFLFALYTIGVCLSNADAKSYHAKQRDIDFSSDDLLTFLNESGVKIDGPEELPTYLFDIPVVELLQQAERYGVSPRIIESTLSIAQDKVRFDTTIPMMGEISYVMLPNEKKIVGIFWGRKQYIELTFEDINQMQAQAAQPGGLLERLPPEARAQLDQLPPEVRERMKGQLGGQSTEESEPVHVKKTGKMEKINGFDCAEYLVEGTTHQQIWVSEKYPDLRKSFETVLTKLPSFDKSQKKNDKHQIWENIASGWPVIMKEFEFNPRRIRQASLNIQEIVSMTEKSLPLDTFDVPGGFERTTLEEMMFGGRRTPKP